MKAVSPAGRARLNTVLYVLVVLIACAVILLGVLLVKDRDSGSSADDATAAQDARGNDLHRAVVAAASSEVLAFVNVDHRKLDESTEAVRKGATGQFAEEYDKSLEGLRDLMTRNKSVMEGEILAAGVVNADQDSARVLVATKGTVQNVSTGDKKAERNLRIQVDLEYVDGAWLTSDLQFVP